MRKTKEAYERTPYIIVCFACPAVLASVWLYIVMLTCTRPFCYMCLMCVLVQFFHSISMLSSIFISNSIAN